MEKIISQLCEKEELPKRNEICLKNQQLKELESILKKLENHKYDPKCKFCILHPIVKQKREKELEIQELNKVIENLTKNLEISLEECNKIEEDEKIFLDIQQKLNEKTKKLSTVENILVKMELEIEKSLNKQEMIPYPLVKHI